MAERNVGDKIQFQVMPWVYPNAKIHNGTITKIVENNGDTYYHVDAIVGKEHVEGGMVFEREVVAEDKELRVVGSMEELS